MVKLVLLRHGESHWNKENRFTGWTDVDLSKNGIQEAKQAGWQLKQEGYFFDIAYTSFLKRAIRTLWIVQDVMDLMWIPVLKTWRLNERHYGSLQGLDQKSWPVTKCLKDTVDRFMPFWTNTIAPSVQQGKKIIIAAHGNTLHAMVMHLDGISAEQILKTNLPAGIPLVYELDKRLKPIKSYYLGDPDKVRQAMASVVAQGKTK